MIENLMDTVLSKFVWKSSVIKNISYYCVSGTIWSTLQN